MNPASLFAALIVGLAAADVVNLDQLNAAIDSGDNYNKKVAFLSQANYDAVHTVLSSNVEVVICDGSDGTFASCDTVDELIELIKDGHVLAGLISGLPEEDEAPYLHTFSSTVISLKTMYMAPPYSEEMPHGTVSTAKSSLDLSKAVDAAIVRLQSEGKDEDVRQANLPFEFMAVHTCRTDDPSLFEVPNFDDASGLLDTTLSNKVLKVGALGPYDWGGNDGDYTKDPPVGFYPDWLTVFCETFNALAGPDGVRYDSAGNITCERTYNAPSSAVFKDLLDGDTYVTEPYYVVDAWYTGTGESCTVDTDCRVANVDGEHETCTNGTGGFTCIHPESPRIRHFRLSCSTLGVDSTFMTMRSTVVLTDANETQVVDPDAEINTLAELQLELIAGTNKKVAFLSQANYDSVQTILPDDVEVVVCDSANPDCDSTAKMIEHLISGDYAAGLISGLPEDQYAPYLNTFSSTVISLRAMFMAPPHTATEMPHGTTQPSKSSYDLSLAVDAAIVGLQAAGKDEQAAHDNAPFEFMAVHTCKATEPEKFVVPNSVDATGLLRTTLDEKVLKVGALGPYNWGGNDGDYTQTPPVGFYPDWLTAFCDQFNSLSGPDGVTYDAAGNITCERVNQPSSSKVFRDLFDGVSYVTEPYYTVDAMYTGTAEACNLTAGETCPRAALLDEGVETCESNVCTHPQSPRTRHFRFSCSTLGVDSTFMVAKKFSTTTATGTATTDTTTATGTAADPEEEGSVNEVSGVGITASSEMLLVAALLVWTSMRSW